MHVCDFFTFIIVLLQVIWCSFFLFLRKICICFTIKHKTNCLRTTIFPCRLPYMIFAMRKLSVFTLLHLIFETLTLNKNLNLYQHNYVSKNLFLRDGPFDIQGGWDFFEKNSLFRNRSEKNKMSSKKLQIKNLFFIQ